MCCSPPWRGGRRPGWVPYWERGQPSHHCPRLFLRAGSPHSLGQVHVDCLAVALVNVDTVKDGKSRMWQERVSPRGEGEKMKALLTAKVGMFLVVSSVLAIWTLLVAQHVQAHTTNLSSPSCSGLPTAENFFTSDAEPADIMAGGVVSNSPTPKRGTGTTGEGNTKYLLCQDHRPAPGRRGIAGV